MIRAGQARTARERYREMVVNEQSRRRFVTLEARALGHGGVSLMALVRGWHARRSIVGLSDIAPSGFGPARTCAQEGGRRKKKDA